MSDAPARRGAARSRRVSAGAELGAKASVLDDDVVEAVSDKEGNRPALQGKKMARRTSLPPVVHQRHMPSETKKFHIPRKTQENIDLLQFVASGSREFENIMKILTNNFLETNSSGYYSYSNPRVIHCKRLLEEFIEKRKEMKADGRTEKELEDSYCFLLTDPAKLSALCERGVMVGASWLSLLGNPMKGIYLSKYSDLLHNNALSPGATGEILIFKVMKGKVKSIQDNLKIVIDPTPRFDCHVSKNASNVTSLASFRAFELTQQYFYEYSFDELLQRPRQVCPYAVVSFRFLGKDIPLTSNPLAPLRLNSHPSESIKEPNQFTVWSGDLVKGDRVVYQIALCSSFPPVLPRKLPEKLEITVMRFDSLTRILPSELLSYKHYNSSSKEVVKNGRCCSLLDVIDKGRSSTGVTRLLQELEAQRVVLVTPLTDQGFLFFLSNDQMSPPLERGEGWKRCLQALFVFPESTDGVQSTSPSSLSSPFPPLSNMKAMPHQFIPVLHYALIKARANPPPELAVGVEQHAREYLAGQIGGKVRPYPMGEYDGDLDELGIPYPAPKHHRLTMEGYLSSYLYKPAFYQLSLTRACKLMEAHCSPEKVVATDNCGRDKETVGKAVADEPSNTQKMQETIALVLAYKQKASNEVKREEGKDGALTGLDRKRKLEQKTAERTIKYLKASQESLGNDKIPVDPGHTSALQTSLLTSLLNSVGLKDFGLREDGTEITANLVNLLTDLKRSASEASSENCDELQEEEKMEAFPFNKLALKLGLPTNCDIDLRKQEELEDQMADSNSSLEGFSPISLTGELNHKKGGRKKRKSEPYEEEEEETEWEIPWVLIPISGLCSGRYDQPDGNLPQDPRFHHRTMATDNTTTALPPRESPTPPLRPSPSASPSPCPSPEPSPPSSPLQCPSPEQSPPYSPSQWSSLEHLKHKCPPKSPHQASPPLTDPAQPSSPHRPPSFHNITPDPSSHQFTAHPNELHKPSQRTDGANEWHSNTAVFRESAGTSKKVDPRLQRRRQQLEDSLTSVPVKPANHVMSERTAVRSLPDSDQDSDEGLMIISEETENEEETCDSAGVMRPDLTKEMEEEAQEPQEEFELQPNVADNNKNSNVETLETSSLCSPDVSTSSRDIGSILDKCQVDFTSSLQHLLQSKNVAYTAQHVPLRDRSSSFPQLSHCALLPSSDAKVEHYVNSLQQSIMKEFDVSWPGVTPQSDQTETLLASRVNEFVENIRASTCVANGSQGAATGAKDDGAFGHIPSDVPAKLSPPTSVTSSTTFNSPPNDSAQPDGDPLASSMLPEDACVAPDSSGRIILPSTSTAVGHAGSKEACRPFAQPPSGPLQSSERVPTPDAVGEPAEEPAPLSSLISRLQPDLLNNLLEIVKDIKRSTPLFYVHSSLPDDEVIRDIKEFLVRQGCVEQNPVMFITQGTSDARLLVIIRNKEISVHVHTIPGLVALKRHRSVQFVGVDSLANIRDSIWNEIFVCGGCIISDDLILNPDFIKHERLGELLMFLEKQSSPQSIWRWKVHSKTHKKLKEQARFRRDAAKLLEVVSTFQKRQIIEFLPDHHCDKNPQSPDLDCLLELQGRYTQFRHTIFLIEHRIVNYAAYFSKGIIVASFNDVLENFTQLVGYHDIKEKLFIMEDLLSAKDENPPDPSSCEAPDPPESSSGPPSAPDLPAAEAPYGDLLNPSESDLEILHQAISHLRAERQAQKERQHQSEINSGTTPSCTFTQRSTDDASPDSSRHFDPNTKGVMDTLNSIHMVLSNPETETTRTEPDPPHPADMLEAKHSHKSVFLSSPPPPSTKSDFTPETCDSTQDAAREVHCVAPSSTSSVPPEKDDISDLPCDLTLDGPVPPSCVNPATSDTLASASPSQFAQNISKSTWSQQQIPRLGQQNRQPRSKGFYNPVSQRLTGTPIQRPTVAMYSRALGMPMPAPSSWMNSSLWQRGLIPSASSALLWPSQPNASHMGRMGFHPGFPSNYQNQRWQGGRFSGK